MNKLFLLAMVLLFTVPMVVGANEWVLRINLTFEDNDITPYIKGLEPIGAGGTNNFSIKSDHAKTGSYSLGFDDTGTADHIAYIENSTFFVNRSAYNYSIRGWWMGLWDTEYTGWGMVIESGGIGTSLNNFYGVGGGESSDKTIIYELNSGTRTLTLGAVGSSIVTATWYWLEGYMYTNNTIQSRIYDAPGGTLIASHQKDGLSGHTTGYMGFMGMRSARLDNVEFYRWEESAPAYSLPDNVADADWVYPATDPDTDNQASVVLNWSDSTSSVGDPLNYSLYVNGSLEWSGIGVTNYTWSLPSEAHYLLRVDVQDNGTWVTGDDRVYKYD